MPLLTAPAPVAAPVAASKPKKEPKKSKQGERAPFPRSPGIICCAHTHRRAQLLRPRPRPRPLLCLYTRLLLRSSPSARREAPNLQQGLPWEHFLGQLLRLWPSQPHDQFLQRLVTANHSRTTLPEEY